MKELKDVIASVDRQGLLYDIEALSFSLIAISTSDECLEWQELSQYIAYAGNKICSLSKKLKRELNLGVIND